MMNKKLKDASQLLVIKITEKYLERIFERSRSDDYAEGYADGLKDMMEVTNEFVKSEIEKQLKAGNANLVWGEQCSNPDLKVESKEETDTEQIVANFFRRIS